MPAADGVTVAVFESGLAGSARVERRRRRANIVATLGPATSTAERVRELAEAGMDVARVNPSHGTHEEHRHLCELAHAAGTALGRPIAVLADVAGPKIRVGQFVDGGTMLCAGDRFVLTTDPCDGTVRTGVDQLRSPCPTMCDQATRSSSTAGNIYAFGCSAPTVVTS